MSGRLFATREVLQAGALATGNGTPLNVAGLSRVGLDVSIAGVATVAFEATNDGATWYQLPCNPVGGGAAVVNTTSSGAFLATVSGLSLIRCRISSWGSGAVTVTALATVAAS